MKKYKILILEDDIERVGQFQQMLGESWESYVWNNAHKMIIELPQYLNEADLISLDHDLYTLDEDNNDPGDGVMVAKWLETQKPSCPVIIHSSNTERSRWMLGYLELGGWQTKRVAPIGEDWIETLWISAVKELCQ